MYFDETFAKKIFTLGFLFTLILIIIDLLVFFFYPDTRLSEIFLATREQTPLTWVSVIILLLIGLSSATVYFKTRARIWYFLSLAFLFFSMDDGTYFHERVAGALQDLFSPLGNFPSYSWVVLYAPLLVFSLVGFIFMLWRDASNKDKKLLTIAFLILAVALGLDMLDGFILKDSSLVFCLTKICNSSVTHIIRLFEESLEVFGFGILAYLNIKEHSFLK